MTDFERPTTDPTGAPPASATDADTTAVPVPTAAIEPPRSQEAGTRQNRTRWLAAGVLIALVVGVTALATLVLTGSRSTSVVLGYVPTDSVAFGELRLDLPGDQRQAVGEFLSKFPGFADQAALETKLDEVLDRLVSEGSGGQQTFTKDIKPWFDGQLGFSMGPIPTAAGDGSDHPAKDVRALMLMSVKDAALARSWFTTTLEQGGLTGTPETYGGTDLIVFSSSQGSDTQAAFTVAGGKVAIVGDVASVKAAIDTNGSSAQATSAGVSAAQAALPGDDIGFMFVDTKALIEASTKLTGAEASMPPLGAAITALVPDWAAARVRVEGDALRLDAVNQHADAMPGPDANRANGVAAFAPPSTVALVAANEYGQTLLEWIALYRSEPALADAFAQIDQAAGMLGGVEALLDWMGDAGIVVATTADGVEGGIVSIPADAAGGRQLLTTLRSFLQLGGAQAGITVRDEPYNGETITVLDLGDLSGLAGLAGAMSGVPVPTDPGVLPEGNVQIAYVATDQVIAIGSSVDFIKHVLDAGAGVSLADDARYQGLVGRVDAEHTGLTFLDITAIRGLIEGAMADAPPADRAEYEESVKPFLTPFDAFIATRAVGGDVDQAHSVVTVK